MSDSKTSPDKQAPRKAICAIERALDLLIQPGETTQYELAANIAAELERAGYRVVPAEPTETMLAEGAELLLDGRLEIEAAEANARGVWRAMVGAAR